MFLMPSGESLRISQRKREQAGRHPKNSFLVQTLCLTEMQNANGSQGQPTSEGEKADASLAAIYQGLESFSEAVRSLLPSSGSRL